MVATPQPLVGYVGERRAVLEAEEPEQPEHHVGVGAGVGDHDVGALAAVLAVEHVDDMQGVPDRAGDHLGGQSGGLVAHHVEPGDALLDPKYLRFGRA